MSSIRIEDHFEEFKPKIVIEAPDYNYDYIEILLIACIAVTTIRCLGQYLYNTKKEKVT